MRMTEGPTGAQHCQQKGKQLSLDRCFPLITPCLGGVVNPASEEPDARTTRTVQLEGAAFVLQGRVDPRFLDTVLFFSALQSRS